MVEAAQQRGLAGARGAQQHRELAPLKVQGGRVQRSHTARKSDMHIVHLDHGNSLTLINIIQFHYQDESRFMKTNGGNFRRSM